MPQRPEYSGDSDSSEQVSYPLDTIREVANDILAAVRTARTQHETHWHTIQHYITVQCAPSYKPFGITPSFFPFSGDVSSHMKDVLDPHAQRLTNSYDWLEKFANAMLKAAQAVEDTDKAVQQSFQPEQTS